MNKSWFNIAVAEDSTEAEISIYDSIGGYEINAKNFADQLKALEVDTIHLRINSPGGSVIDGTAIFNALQRHSATVITHIDGLAASMASVIAMAGDEVRMADNALLMIHNPWTMSIGDADELRKDADLLDKMRDIILSSYARSQYEPDELKDLMDAETWFTAKEALDAGFIDAIETGLKAAAELSATAAINGIKIPTEKQVAAISQQLEATERSRAEIQAANAQLNEKLAKSAADLETAKSSITSLQTAVDEQKAAVEAVKGQLVAKDAEIEKSKEITQAKIAQKAAELVQAQSHDPVADEDETKASLTAETLLEEYSKLTDHVARRKFRDQHKDEFNRLLRA